jgi:hypothetical protein
MSKYLQTILISGLFGTLVCISSVNAQSPVNCDEIKVKTKISNTSVGENNGKILIEFEEPEKADSYKIVMFGVGWDKPQEGSVDGFKNLEAGFYDIYLIDKKGCSKQLNVQVK